MLDFRPLLPDIGRPDAVYRDFATWPCCSCYGKPLRLRARGDAARRLPEDASTPAADRPRDVERRPRVSGFRHAHVFDDFFGQPRLAGSALIWEHDGIARSRLEGTSHEGRGASHRPLDSFDRLVTPWALSAPVKRAKSSDPSFGGHPNGGRRTNLRVSRLEVGVSVTELQEQIETEAERVERWRAEELERAGYDAERGSGARRLVGRRPPPRRRPARPRLSAGRRDANPALTAPARAGRAQSRCPCSSPRSRRRPAATSTSGR